MFDGRDRAALPHPIPIFAHKKKYIPSLAETQVVSAAAGLSRAWFRLSVRAEPCRDREAFAFRCVFLFGSRNARLDALLTRVADALPNPVALVTATDPWSMARLLARDGYVVGVVQWCSAEALLHGARWAPHSRLCYGGVAHRLQRWGQLGAVHDDGF